MLPLITRTFVCTVHLASHLGSLLCVRNYARRPAELQTQGWPFYHMTDFFPTPDHALAYQWNLLVIIQFLELVGERSFGFLKHSCFGKLVAIAS